MIFVLTSVEAHVFASIPICMTGKLETTLPESVIPHPNQHFS